MSRVEGISISKITLPSGTVVYKARVKRYDGTYDSTNYRTALEAKRGAMETLRGFTQTVGSPIVPLYPDAGSILISAAQKNLRDPNVPVVWFAPLCRGYAAQQRILGRREDRAVVFENIANAIDREGWGDLNSGVFGKRLLKWLSELTAGWSNVDPNWKGRRKNRLELTNTYRNNILEKINCVILHAMTVDNSPVLRNPLVRMSGTTRLQKFPEPNKLKPTFQVSELRLMVRRDVDKWHLPACLLIYTGCRAQEAMFARWEWFDWDARIIKLQYSKDDEDEDQAELKTGERIIPIQQELYDILRHYGIKKEGFIIEHEPLRTNGSLKNCKRTKPVKHAYTEGLRLFCKRAGVDPGERTAHSLRHNYAAMMFAMHTDSVVVMDALGHSEIETTLRYAKSRAAFAVAVKNWPKGEFQLLTGNEPLQFKKAN